MVVVFAFAKANSQIVINELDADTPSFDTEEFIELKTASPFQSLDGYIMVLFNGSTSTTTGQGRSYYVEDLDGLVSDSNGLVVLGSSDVVPAVDRLLGDGRGTFQNGPDAVAIYVGEPSDFPDRTFARNDQSLVDALVYDTNDSDSEELLNLLGRQFQYNEGPNNNTNSLQLQTDGTFEAKTPTPHSLNDATEPSYIGINFSILSTEDLNEGDFFIIEFTLTKPAPDDFNLNFSLSNGSFDTTDFTGSTSIAIPAGGTSQTLEFDIIDDTIDEGDEFLRINLGNNLPAGYKRLRDNVEFLIIDNDFTVSNYGTPLNPTYGIVQSTAPEDYYSSLEGLASPELQQAITDIIAETGVVREHTYSDITTILKDADASPTNSNKIWLLYTEEELRDVYFQGNNNSNVTWNREHVFPRSRGGYFSIKEDDVADGINVWVETSVDSLRHGNSDAHHLRAADSGTNSSRGNKNYGVGGSFYNGPDGSQGSWHGDVARSVFYMVLRYTGLDVVNGDPESSQGLIGDLATLVEWHRQDPPDDFEMHRNNVIYEWQINRNPFIDDPEMVEYIWGSKQGQSYTLSSESETLAQIKVFPNPSSNYFFIQNVTEDTKVTVIDALGRTAFAKAITSDIRIDNSLASGIYFIRLETDNGTDVQKMIVE